MYLEMTLIILKIRLVETFLSTYQSLYNQFKSILNQIKPYLPNSRSE